MENVLAINEDAELMQYKHTELNTSANCTFLLIVSSKHSHRKNIAQAYEILERSSGCYNIMYWL